MNIIQTWKSNEVPHYYYSLIEQLRQLNKPCKFLFFTDKNIIDFMANEMPQYYETFVNLKYKIQQLDFFRYLAIYHYGGLYLDLDMEITQSFENMDVNKCTFPVETQGKFKPNMLIGNYAFYAPKGDPFVKHIIDNIVNPPITMGEIETAQSTHTDDKQHVYVYFTTGPELVTRAYWSYSNREDIQLLEPDTYEENCFGNYGKHKCFGSWKHPQVDQSPMKI
jgi:mannosyltransferase OCH1-like enzyme